MSCITINVAFNGGTFPQANDNGTGNEWDDGSEGNYRSKYNGQDEDNNNDGVGDTSYNIDGPAGSQDGYSLMEPVDTYPPEKISEMKMPLLSMTTALFIYAVFRKRNGDLIERESPPGVFLCPRRTSALPAPSGVHVRDYF